jgi:predicted DsbA family dithiol-disulfide isomerase
MRVEIWSDLICPWCGLGQHRLEQALQQLGRTDVEVVHRSYQLDPGHPAQTQSVREMLAKKYGASEAQIESMTGRVERLAKADGLQPYRVGDNRVGNTALAHQFAAWASAQGKGRDAWKLLYQTYFGEGGDIFEQGALAALAPRLGLDADDARAALAEGRYAAQVNEDAREAAAMGSNGVPFIVIDRRYAIEGAQPTELMVQALQAAAAEASRQIARS